ncbi:MAG: VWA domain-containing protein [Candidatus Eisenbacteria bacterium]|nr:VWA domain-containing protein [Candidatus Eisenbacteria bacterium]
MPTLGFLNSIFLAGLAAAALPVLIHLFSRRKARDVPFSTLTFLQEINRKKIRRMRLRQWLLLALRVLIIALFALAMGRPVVKGLGNGGERGPSTLAIILDDSYSMDALLAAGGAAPETLEPEALTRFELARQRANEILDMLQDGDRVLLVRSADPPQMPYETPVQDFRLIREVLERADVRRTRSDLTAAVERVRELLADSKTLNKEIFIISDFQQADGRELLRRFEGTQAPVAEADTAEVQAAASGLLPMPPETQVYLLPVWGERRDNAALRRVDHEPDPVDPARGGRLVVQARNYSESPVEPVVARAFTAGPSPELVGESAFPIPPMDVAQTEMALADHSAGEVDGFWVELTPDALEIDNRYFIALGEDRTYRILLVLGGNPEDPEVEQSSRYLQLALDPRRADAASPLSRLFSVESVAADDLALMGEIRADAVVLLDVGRIPVQGVEALAAYHARGGGIFVVAGDRVDPRYYNTVVLDRLSNLRLMGIETTESRDAYFVLRPERTGHPIFEGFPVGPGENLSQTRFRKALEVRLGETGQVIASFSNGIPALVEDTGVLLFTSSFDGTWSEFPTSGAFLPLVHKSLFHLIRREEGRGSGLRAGESLRWRTDPGFLGGARVVCRGPEGLQIPVERRQSGEGLVLATEPLPLPGIYRLITDSGRLLTRAAVNLDTEESDLHAMSETQMEILFGSDAVRLEGRQAFDRSLLEARFGKELWRPLLMIVFLLLVVESLLARGRVAP